jgi:hypothetical protein
VDFGDREMCLQNPHIKPLFMKTIKMLFVMIMVIVACSSCADENLRPSIGVGIGTDPMTGQLRVQLSVSVGYPGYPPLYNSPMYGTYYAMPYPNQTSVAYILSRPVNQTAIPVFDAQGRQIGIVNCVTGDWRECNRLFEYIRGWNYSQPFAVLVQWTALNEGNIVG